MTEVKSGHFLAHSSPGFFRSPIQPVDTQYPIFSWVEVIDCFNESIDIFAKYLKGWIITKNNPELVENKGKR
jgi:hypothetical protein